MGGSIHPPEENHTSLETRKREKGGLACATQIQLLAFVGGAIQSGNKKTVEQL